MNGAHTYAGAFMQGSNLFFYGSIDGSQSSMMVRWNGSSWITTNFNGYGPGTTKPISIMNNSEMLLYSNTNLYTWSGSSFVSLGSINPSNIVSMGTYSYEYISPGLYKFYYPYNGGLAMIKMNSTAPYSEFLYGVPKIMPGAIHDGTKFPVYKWDGSTLTDITPAGTSTSASYPPDLVTVGSGTTILAVNNGSAYYKIYSWNGTTLTDTTLTTYTRIPKNILAGNTTILS